MVLVNVVTKRHSIKRRVKFKVPETGFIFNELEVKVGKEQTTVIGTLATFEADLSTVL